MRTELETMKK